MPNKAEVRSDNIATAEGSRSFIETARRSQIIACAIETIAEVGYTNASLAQIAQRAGISKGVISYHFAGKEELVREIVKEVYQLAVAFMGARMQAKTSARSRLRAYIESNLEFMGHHRQELLALVGILVHARTKEGELLFKANAEEPILQGIEQIFLEGQQSGEFRAFAVRPMAIALRGVIDAAPGKLLFTPDFDLAAYSKEVADLFDTGTRA